MRANAELLKRRRTKIIATLGPSSSDAAVVGGLIRAGVSAVRLNMSHGDHDTHSKYYELVRAAAHEGRVPIGILADLCGPKIRVGRFSGGALDPVEGDTVTVTTRDVQGGPGIVPSQWRTLHEEIDFGGRILLHDCRLELAVEQIVGTEIACMVVRGGMLKDRKGMNLPDSKLSAPALTDKDRVDAAFAQELGVDDLALSFVRAADDVLELRSRLPPSCPTRSISTNPGTASSHCAQVRILMASLSSDPGLVWLRPRSAIAARSGANRRSMVAGDIATSSAAVASLITSSSNRRNRTTRSANTGASRLPVGTPSTAQHNRSATTASGP